MNSAALRRLLKDESGMTMGLVIIMIVLIGVMGAGLLTFVSTDLTIVANANRGQRAFELTDAGVQAAGRQLSLRPNSACYNGIGDDGELPWSGGVALENLGTENASADGVTVGIRFVYSGSADNPEFIVTSTGVYGDAIRKTEAVYVVESNAGESDCDDEPEGSAGRVRMVSWRELYQ